MGVRTRRIGFAALLLVAVLLPLHKPAQKAPPAEEDRSERLRELIEEQRVARTRWIALSERDSVLARTERGMPGKEPLIHYAGFARGVRDEVAEAELSRLWKAIGPLDPTVAVSVEVYNRARYSSTELWSAYSGNLISPEGGVTHCTALVPAALRESGQLHVWKESLHQALAPCVLLAAFGPPGESIRAWLATTRYTAARSNSWLTRPANSLEGGSGPWGWMVGRSSRLFETPPRIPRVFGLEARAIASLLTPPYHYGAAGIRCIVGDRPACVESVMRSGHTTADTADIPADLSLSRGMLRPNVVTLATPRSPADFFVSDLIRIEGRERFRSFWKSSLSFEAAFQSAFGVSLGEWTSQWAKRQWLGSWEARYRSKVILLGPNLDPSWPLVALLWTVLALAATGWVARRKQVLT